MTGKNSKIIIDKIDELTKKYNEIDEISNIKMAEYRHENHEFMMYSYNYKLEKAERIKEQKKIKKMINSLKEDVIDELQIIKMSQLIHAYEDIHQSINSKKFNFINNYKQQFPEDFDIEGDLVDEDGNLIED